MFLKYDVESAPMPEPPPPEPPSQTPNIAAEGAGKLQWGGNCDRGRFIRLNWS